MSEEKHTCQGTSYPSEGSFRSFHGYICGKTANFEHAERVGDTANDGCIERNLGNKTAAQMRGIWSRNHAVVPRGRETHEPAGYRLAYLHVEAGRNEKQAIAVFE
jgi:hypothetical protein